jgi:hypothetical protein
MLESDVATGRRNRIDQEVPQMFQANTTSAARSAIIAIGFLGVVAVGFAARGSDPADAPLGAADDYGTRHAAAEAASIDDGPAGMTHGKLVLAPQLGLADDFATRQAAAAAAVELGLADDFGTRNAAPAAEPAQLSTSDDYGTRHWVEPVALGPNDDYATRNAR